MMPGNTLHNLIQRCFHILEAFSPLSPKMRLQELTEKTGLPKVTVFRFLKTLVALNYLEYDEKNKTYSLSPRVMGLGFTVLCSMELREIANPILRELAEKVNQNVNLGILDGLEIVYIERIKKKQILNIDLHVGSRLSAYNTSIGLVILAYMPEEKIKIFVRDLLLEKAALEIIGQNGELLLNQLQEVRAKGYAINDENYIKGLRAIAAPVFNHEGIVEAGINIPVFANLVSKEELISKYLPHLLEAAQRISYARGFILSPKGGTNEVCNYPFQSQRYCNYTRK